MSSSLIAFAVKWYELIWILNLKSPPLNTPIKVMHKNYVRFHTDTHTHSHTHSHIHSHTHSHTHTNSHKQTYRC